MTVVSTLGHHVSKIDAFAEHVSRLQKPLIKSLSLILRHSTVLCPMLFNVPLNFMITILHKHTAVENNQNITETVIISG